VDLNVPTHDGVVQDISRIKNIASTIEFLKKAGAKIILISHLGKTMAATKSNSLQVVIKDLSNEYNSNVVFIDDYINQDVTGIIDAASYNDIILLENLRFHPEEEGCCVEFAKKLAKLGDFYINEAFSVSHRRHASICELPKLLPHAFGLSFLNEIKIIDDFLNVAKPPKMSIIGGAKLSTKVKLLKNLSKKVDKLALGGGIAGAFLAFQGNSLLSIFNQKEFEADVAEILENAKKFRCEIILPIDFSALIGGSCDGSIISCNEISASVFDVGPATVELFKRHIRESATILWNGPVGLFEKTPFDYGTMSLAREVGELSRDGKIVSIVGGGDTAFAMNKFGVAKYLTYQSTSGGAFLTYLEGGELPGISAMKNDCYTIVDMSDTMVNLA
jgi:phosphoglycerate kinase